MGVVHNSLGVVYDPLGVVYDPMGAVYDPMGAVYAPMGAVYGPMGPFTPHGADYRRDTRLNYFSITLQFGPVPVINKVIKISER